MHVGCVFLCAWLGLILCGFVCLGGAYVCEGEACHVRYVRERVSVLRLFVSPRCRSGKSVLVAFFAPGLPKWVNFTSTLSSLAEELNVNGSALAIVKANCREHPVSVCV